MSDLYQEACAASEGKGKREDSMVKALGAIFWINDAPPLFQAEWPETEVRCAKEPKKGDGGPGSGTAIITRTQTQTRRPHMYRVLLLNDDYTTQEFVIVVLRKYFNKSVEEATRIMLHVHNHGVGECGVYTYEVAETKVTQVMDFARKHQHPLQCIMEKK